jgi:hypothetical protein
VAAATPGLERFVRSSLGCRCPDEVFDEVEVSREPPAGCPEVGRRILVGGRLLIYVIEGVSTDEALGRIEDWVLIGHAERERRGMNRLRLAVTLADPNPGAEPALQDRFRALPLVAGPAGLGEDPRLHLHLLPFEAVEALWDDPAP